jgi:hypothetical protein
MSRFPLSPWRAPGARLLLVGSAVVTPPVAAATAPAAQTVKIDNFTFGPTVLSVPSEPP